MYNGKNVAVKQQYAREAIPEIEVLEKLDHVNVVKLIATKREGPYTLMALELCRGSLEDVLFLKENVNGLSQHGISKLMTDIVLGYGYLSDQRVYHGDIKPANILIGTDGTYKFADFGFSKIVENKQLFRNRWYSCLLSSYFV